MSSFEQIKGNWKHAAPWDSDDFLALYSISGTEDNPMVAAVDLNDGEKFEISNVRWSDGILSFESYMPSTKRHGLCNFSIGASGTIVSEYTFTVVEELVRE